MKKFIFSFKPITKPTKSSPKTKVNNYIVVEKKAIALCCITLNGEYYAASTHGDIKFTKKSYKIKSNKLYSQQLIGNKLYLYIHADEVNKYPNICFLPFAPSIYVMGQIIKYNDSDELYFDFKKSTYIKSDTSKKQFMFYKNNYNIIHKNFLCHIQNFL